MSPAAPLRLSIAAIALLVLSAIAFWPPYLSKLRAAESYAHVHAALGTSWLALLAVQPLLIRAARRATHRLLGRIGVVLGIAFAASGVLVSHRSLVRMSTEEFAREGRFVYLPLAMACIFAVALALAVRWRTMPSVHARFMAATALPLLDPLLARILYFHGPALPAQFMYQLPAFTLITVALVALVRTLPAGSPGRRHLRRFALGTIGALLGFFVVPHLAAWQHFVAWFRALPLT